MVSKKKLEEVAEKASKAFWTVVQEEFPHLNPDNLDTGTVIVLQWQMKESIERYLQNGEDEDGGSERTPDPRRNGHGSGR